MKRKLICVVCFVSFALLAGCSGMPTTPKETAVRYYQAVEKRDCGWIAKYVLELKKQRNLSGSTEDEIKQRCQEMIRASQKPPLKKVEATDEKIKGDTAHVIALATYEDNTTQTAEYDLTKIGNIWAVSDYGIEALAK